MIIKKPLLTISLILFPAFLLFQSCAHSSKEKKQSKKTRAHYEINNSELISLRALPVSEIEFVKFKLTTPKSAKTTYFQEVEKEKITSGSMGAGSRDMQGDEIKTLQSVTKRPEIQQSKVKQSGIKQAEKEGDEEMVMFDYSNKTIDQKLYEQPLSRTVQMAISREIGKGPFKNLSKTNAKMNTEKQLEEVMNDEENIIYDYSRPVSKTGKKEAVLEFTSKTKNENEEGSFFLQGKEINLSTQEIVQSSGFEFVPDYDRAERVNDEGSGSIEFGYLLSKNSTVNTETGVVIKTGMIPTRVELNLDEYSELEIPLIDEEGMQNFLKKQGLMITGNLLTMALDSSIKDTEIDSRFAERFFFDDEFKPLQSSVGASFVMYAGVRTGNVMIRYHLANGESVQKIVFVGDGEMYFEDASFISGKRETYVLTTRSILGQKRRELIIDGSLISYLNTNNTAKKKALNAYDIKIPSLVSGMRKYFEFKHLKENIFVGISNEGQSENEIEIPSYDFILKVLEKNELSSLKDRCVVQLNLKKEMSEIKVSGKNRSGEMFVETSFLDSDGNFSHGNELAEKAFLVGDLEGLFSARIDYIDGSSEFLKTYCSDGSYIVEQL